MKKKKFHKVYINPALGYNEDKNKTIKMVEFIEPQIDLVKYLVQNELAHRRKEIIYVMLRDQEVMFNLKEGTLTCPN